MARKKGTLSRLSSLRTPVKVAGEAASVEVSDAVQLAQEAAEAPAVEAVRKEKKKTDGKTRYQWGGARPGAGRPKGVAKYGASLTFAVSPEIAAAVRALGGSSYLRAVTGRDLERRALAEANLPEGAVPVALDPATVKVPRVDMNAACGFPSPAADYESEEFNLNDFFVNRPAATYVVQASGDSMIDAGIFPRDILIVDRSLTPRNGDIVLAFYDGSFTVKRFYQKDGHVELHPENATAGYPVLTPDPLESFSIEGVVTGVGRKFR